MKRGDVLRHILSQGCVIRREGSRHTILFNPDGRRFSALSRQTEIGDRFVREICRQLGIDPPGRS